MAYYIVDKIEKGLSVWVEILLSSAFCLYYNLYFSHSDVNRGGFFVGGCNRQRMKAYFCFSKQRSIRCY